MGVRIVEVIADMCEENFAIMEQNFATMKEQFEAVQSSQAALKKENEDLKALILQLTILIEKQEHRVEAGQPAKERTEPLTWAAAAGRSLEMGSNAISIKAQGGPQRPAVQSSLFYKIKTSTTEEVKEKLLAVVRQGV
jgi:hypothetical protein